jgi:uncharacterized membrane protein
MTANPVTLSVEETEALRVLRAKRRKSRLDNSHHFGNRISDWVAATVGSWRFVIIQTILMVCWLLINIFAWVQAWDPYPFILLNLVLSFQAAYTAPIIMMSQNRQSEVDRKRLQEDYDINLKAELEIELLHQKIDLLKEQEIIKLQQMVQQLLDQMARGKTTPPV